METMGKLPAARTGMLGRILRLRMGKPEEEGPVQLSGPGYEE
jgi:hypothetical protein